MKQEAEEWASRQGVSLNQFIMWSVADKVASLKQGLDDPNFPGITYRRGASGSIAPVIRGLGLRVQTLVIDSNQQMSTDAIATEYDLEPARVREAIAFYAAHPAEIDADIQAELALEPKLG
ncbi:MAG: DUF433 domain-containing protein [Thermoflexales bacterium]